MSVLNNLYFGFVYSEDGETLVITSREVWDDEARYCCFEDGDLWEVAFDELDEVLYDGFSESYSAENEWLVDDLELDSSEITEKLNAAGLAPTNLSQY